VGPDITICEFAPMIQEHCPDARTIVEVGSLQGQDALYLASKFPKAKVVVIEGSPINFVNYLQDLPEIMAINAVVTNVIGQANFHLKHDEGLHSLRDRGRAYGHRTIKVDTTTLRNLNLGQIDILKIDAEGCTLEILQGTDLSGIKLLHLETETIQYFKGQALHNEVCEYVLSFGFKLLDSARCKIEEGLQYDTVWLAS